MSTLLFWGLCAAAVLLLLARIPGLNLVLLPVAMMLGGLLKEFVTFIFQWALYIVRIVVRAHLDLLKHFSNPEEEFDIELKMQKRVDRG